MGAYSREEVAGIYRRRFKLVYQVCMVLMKNVPDAEDAAQTVFRRVMELNTPFCDPEHENASTRRRWCPSPCSDRLLT